MFKIILALAVLAIISGVSGMENSYTDNSKNSCLSLEINVINRENTTVIFTIKNECNKTLIIPQNENQKLAISFAVLHKYNEDGRIYPTTLYTWALPDEYGGNITIPPYGQIKTTSTLDVHPDDQSKRYDVYAINAQLMSMLYGGKPLPEGGWRVTCQSVLLAEDYWS